MLNTVAIISDSKDMPLYRSSSLSILTAVVYLKIFTGLVSEVSEAIAFLKFLEKQITQSQVNYTRKFYPPDEKVWPIDMDYSNSTSLICQCKISCKNCST